MAAMLHVRNNTILFLWDKMFILMQNIFIVPGMQHGRHAKPLYQIKNWKLKLWKERYKNRTNKETENLVQTLNLIKTNQNMAVHVY